MHNIIVHHRQDKGINVQKYCAAQGPTAVTRNKIIQGNAFRPPNASLVPLPGF